MSYVSPRKYGKSNSYKQCQTYKWKIHVCGSKKEKNAELVMLKKDPNIHITVALVGCIYTECY